MQGGRQERSLWLGERALPALTAAQHAADIHHGKCTRLLSDVHRYAQMLIEYTPSYIHICIDAVLCSPQSSMEVLGGRFNSL